MVISSLGCYAVIRSKKVLKVLFVMLVLPLIVTYFMLMRMALKFHTEGSSSLRALCANKPNLLADVNFDNIHLYDSMITSLPSGASLFCGSECPCSLHTATHYVVPYDTDSKLIFASPSTMASNSSHGITSIQQCTPQWDQYDRPTQAVFNIMS